MEISLYIADCLVDLDEQSLILMNYTQEDLSNPAIVKNSYSQQITLKGTPQNNRIFGNAFRVERRGGAGGAGAEFNAALRTPFAIYNDLNEVIESGYVKLDAVSRKGADITYTITLYGGLGSFFYALSYDGAGNKRSLADLWYTGLHADHELDFVISADAVQDAWTNARTGSAPMQLLKMHQNSLLKYWDGRITDGDGAWCRVGEYLVNGGEVVEVTGVSSSTTALASAFDASGNLLQVWYAQIPTSVTDLRIALPDGAVRLYVQGIITMPACKGRNLLWSTINFAPAYNGIPDGEFEAAKALFVPSQYDLADTIGDYTLSDGYSVLNLAEAHDEWAVKDLRSYLQRPVVSMARVIEAVCDPANNGGYEVDASAISAGGFPYAGLWMTLPMLPSIGSHRRQSGNVSLSLSSAYTSGSVLGTYNIAGTIPSGARVRAQVSFDISMQMTHSTGSYNTLSNWYRSASGDIIDEGWNVLFVQLVALNSNNDVIGGSDIKVIGAQDEGDAATIASHCGYTPAFAAGYIFDRNRKYNCTFDRDANDYFHIFSNDLSCESAVPARYQIRVSRYAVQMSYIAGQRGNAQYTYFGNGSTCTPVLYDVYGTEYEVASCKGEGYGTNSVTYSTPTTLRSGAQITKRMLLSTTGTPADYLLSLAKMFGFTFMYDNATKKVTIYKRNSYFNNETIDLTQRVDTSKGIAIQPLTYSAHWYDFLVEGVGGAFYDQYLATEGIEYGLQRVNTNYDFNAESVNMMESIVFKNACTILDRSSYYTTITNSNGFFLPSIFVDEGNTYTLWDEGGGTLSTAIGTPDNEAEIEYLNDGEGGFPGYDVNQSRKLELRDADGKPVDGAGVLVFLEGWDLYPHFHLSDDVSAMTSLVGKPCWLLAVGGTGQNSLRVPSFQRYTYSGTSVVEASLDFGTPKEINIPGVNIDALPNTLYEKGWKAYLADRYDKDTKVMTCYVSLAGLQVGQELLRKFYYYGGSIWVLNAIRNYSLTTRHAVECEFVQVQDKTNYTQGQDY